jgi:hypothetical protein
MTAGGFPSHEKSPMSRAELGECWNTRLLSRWRKYFVMGSARVRSRPLVEADPMRGLTCAPRWTSARRPVGCPD